MSKGSRSDGHPSGYPEARFTDLPRELYGWGVMWKTTMVAWFLERTTAENWISEMAQYLETLDLVVLTLPHVEVIPDV